MSLEHINEVLRGAVGELTEAQKDPFATPGKTLVSFFVRGKRHTQQTVDVITVKGELPQEDPPDDVYRSILKAAQSEFSKKNPGKWKVVRHSMPYRTELHNMKRVGINVEMKPPRGWGK